MKIAMISSFLPSKSMGGGVGIQAHELANRLTQKGHYVTIFSLDEKPSNALYNHKHIKLPKFINKKIFLILKPHLFAYMLNKENFSEFDIIHAHGDTQFLFNKKIPIVRTYHGSSLDEAIHSFATGIYNLPKQLYWFIRQLSIYPFEYYNKKSTINIGVSKITKKHLSFIQKIIGCGVNTSIFKPDITKKSKNPSILTISHLYGRDRGYFLLKVFQEKVLKKIPNAELWFVGQHIKSYKNVKSFVNITTNYLISLYQSAWIFCSTSVYEGFGIYYIEALSSGLPIISTPNKGAIEVLKNGEYGILTKDDDLENQIVKLIKNKQLQQELSSKGRNRAMEFSWDKIVQEYEKIYKVYTK